MSNIGGDHFANTAGNLPEGGTSHWYSRELRFARSLVMSLLVQAVRDGVSVSYFTLGLDSREFGYQLQRMITGWVEGDESESPTQEQVKRWDVWAEQSGGLFRWWAPVPGSWKIYPYKAALARMRKLALGCDILVVDSYPKLRESYIEAGVSPSFMKASTDICKAVRRAAVKYGCHAILVNQGSGADVAGGGPPNATAAFTAEVIPAANEEMLLWIRSSHMTGKGDVGVQYAFSGEGDRLLVERSLAKRR